MGRSRALMHDAGYSAAIVIAAVGAYLVLSAVVLGVIDDPIIATLAVDGLVIATVLGLRALRPQWLSYTPPAQPSGFWPWALPAFCLAFLAGQSAALGLYELVGSAGFDAAADTREASNPILVLTLTLVAAPVCEEAMMRGLLYPLLRRRVSVLVSALISATVFAAMHANMVQAAATIPMALLLAMVYERTRTLWPVMVLHAVFNLAAMLVPLAVIAALSTPVMTVLLLAAYILALARVFARIQAGPQGGPCL